MKPTKTYAVFGLGRYGRSVAEELYQSGADVIAVDLNESAVNTAVEVLPVCKCADVTDKKIIEQLGISEVDIVIIAMADSLESSVMATMLCKEAGVPTVIAKCGNEMHKKILQKVGADKVVFPESESGVRLAKNLLSSGFMDMAELSENISLIEVDVKSEWVEKTLRELNLRAKYGINIVALKQNDEITINVDPDRKLEPNDKLIVIADKSKIGRMVK